MDTALLRDELAGLGDELTDGNGFDVTVDQVVGPQRQRSLAAPAALGRLVVMVSDWGR